MPMKYEAALMETKDPRNGDVIGVRDSLKLAAGIAPENRGFPPGFWEIPHLETIFF